MITEPGNSERPPAGPFGLRIPDSSFGSAESGTARRPAVADRLAARAGVRVTAALGFALLATGLALGATTSVASGDARATAWIALSGLGLGLVLPTTIDTALGAVSDESSGVSSGVLQALRMAGGAFGAAILGAIINATYRDELEHATSPILARAARDSAVTDAARTCTVSARSRRLMSVNLEAPAPGGLVAWSAALSVLGTALAIRRDVDLPPGSRSRGHSAFGSARVDRVREAGRVSETSLQ